MHSFANPLKRQQHPSVDSRTSKRVKPDEVHSRKKLLNDLRAICDRWAVHVEVDNSTTHHVVDGKELLRMFLRDILLPPKEKKFSLQECKCRHGEGHLPPGKDMCMTGGTVDAGKANAFVMSDLKQTLRTWLKSKKKHSLVEVTDVEDSDIEISDDEGESQPFPESSYTVSAYPSSPLKPGDVGYKRKSTKQRLCVLTYLVSHSDTRDSFNRAFKQLCEPDLHLVHLCGCGLNIDGLKGACVTGSHLKLAPAELNREHVHYHYVLQMAPSKDAYLKIWDAIRGSAEGRFDDVF